MSSRPPICGRLVAVGVSWGKIADPALVSFCYLVCALLRSISGTTWWCGRSAGWKTEVRSRTQRRLMLLVTIACRPLLVTHRPAHRSKAQDRRRSTGRQNQWRHFRLQFRKPILTMWGCMTHVSRPAFVHVIGFSCPKAYTAPSDPLWCHSRYKPRQGIYFRTWMRAAIWGCQGGSFPNRLSPILYEAPPGPMISLGWPGTPTPTHEAERRRRGRRRGGQAGSFPLLLEAGQAEVGPCGSFFVLMCPFSLPGPLPSRSRPAPDYYY